MTIEAKYHLKCFNCSKNQYRTLCAQKSQESSDGMDDEKNEQIRLVELVEYIERCIDIGTHKMKTSIAG